MSSIVQFNMHDKQEIGTAQILIKNSKNYPFVP